MDSSICSNILIILMCSLLVCSCTRPLRRGFAFAAEGNPNDDVRSSSFHVVNVSTLLEPQDCNCKDTKKGRGGAAASLELFHGHNPCRQEEVQSKGKTDSLTLNRMLTKDYNRVATLLSRSPSNKDGTSTVPFRPGGRYDEDGEYLVSVSLGTPPQKVTLIFDTGSGLTWTQCEPCLLQCFPQTDKIFNPGESASYSEIKCDSAPCRRLNSTSNYAGFCSTIKEKAPCVYTVGYGDGSHSAGFFAKDVLTLTPSDVLEHHLFGCGQDTTGGYGTTAGIFGLSRDMTSFVSQTAQVYNKIFSYCIPSSKSLSGHLTFGNKSLNTSGSPIKFTPMLKNSLPSELYMIELKAISVAGQKLAIRPIGVSEGNTIIIDSGTQFTFLPQEAFAALVSSVELQMRKENYTRSPAADQSLALDLCYDFSEVTEVKVPKISLFFRGHGQAADVEVPIHPTGTFFCSSRNKVCLAFGPTSSIGSGYSIFGNMQQRTLDVVYDVLGEKIGFSLAGC